MQNEYTPTYAMGRQWWIMSLSLLLSFQKWNANKGSHTMRAVGRTITASATRIKYFELKWQEHTFYLFIHFTFSQHNLNWNQETLEIRKHYLMLHIIIYGQPVVCFGSWEWVVVESQNCEHSLCGIGQGPCATIPGEPGTELTEILKTNAVI